MPDPEQRPHVRQWKMLSLFIAGMLSICCLGSCFLFEVLVHPTLLGRLWWRVVVPRSFNRRRLQKASFGSSFEYIVFVDCDVSPAKCKERKIENYPTWIKFTNGVESERKTGVQPLNELRVFG